MGNYTVYMHIFPNNKKYIGITSQKPERRWQNGFGYPKERQIVMLRAIKKYGWNNIKHEILHEHLSCDKAKELEKFYIEKYNTTNKSYGYNTTTGGDSHVTKPVLYDGVIYQSLEQFCQTFELSLRTVSSWLNEQVPMEACYYDNGLRYVDQKAQIIRGKTFKKKIIFNNKIYDSLRDFCREFSLNAGTVSSWLNGKKVCLQNGLT